MITIIIIIIIIIIILICGFQIRSFLAIRDRLYATYAASASARDIDAEARQAPTIPLELLQDSNLSISTSTNTSNSNSTSSSSSNNLSPSLVSGGVSQLDKLASSFSSLIRQQSSATLALITAQLINFQETLFGRKVETATAR